MSEIVTSIFGQYGTSGALQAIIDKRLDKFKKRIFSEYLTWDTPQVDLSYADVIGRSRIEAIASVIGEDAASPVRSRQGLEKLEGKIPTISHKYLMKSSDYRNYITLQNQNNVSDDTKKKQIIDLIFNDVKNAADGCTARVDVMFLQALSTGKIDLSVANNPDGVAYGQVDMLLPADNILTTDKVWSDPTAKPSNDFERVISASQEKGNGDFAKILMTRPTFNKLKDSAEIQAIFKNSNKDNYALVTLARVNDFMTSSGFPEIELQDSLFGLEQDGAITTFKAFADDVIVFVPQGQLGTVKNGLVVEGDLMQVSGHSYANVDKVKIAKWSKTEPMNEFTRGQLHAIPAITAIDAVYHLKLKLS